MQNNLSTPVPKKKSVQQHSTFHNPLSEIRQSDHKSIKAEKFDLAENTDEDLINTGELEFFANRLE